MCNRETLQSVGPTRTTETFYLNILKVVCMQWRAQLHLHEYQAGLGAPRHAGDGLHRVDRGDYQDDLEGEEEDTHGHCVLCDGLYSKCNELKTFLVIYPLQRKHQCLQTTG